MIHQHFKLVDVFTATENIVLGIKETKGTRFNLKREEEEVSRIAAKYGFDIKPDRKIYDMAVSEKQTVEIIKVLYRGADILILDEPTAVLTPQETAKLFAVLRRMRDDGKSIIIITHKMHEVLSISDRVAVLRRGEHIATVETKHTNETDLTEMMVGKKVTLNIERGKPKNPADRLCIEGLCLKTWRARRCWIMCPSPCVRVRFSGLPGSRAAVRENSWRRSQDSNISKREI